MPGPVKKSAIHLERNAPDRLLPRDFGDILWTRYFPVLSLTYISTVIGIAASKGDFLHYIFVYKSAYFMALFVAVWVSIPAVLWIILHGNALYRHVADDWYKITAAIMMIFMIISYVLFPEADVWGLKIYFAASMPIMVIMYFFFVKGGLPKAAAYPLTVLGLIFLIYGIVLNLI